MGAVIEDARWNGRGLLSADHHRSVVVKYRTKHIAWITPSFPFGIKPATEAGLTFGKEVERLRKGFRLLKRNAG